MGLRPDEIPPVVWRLVLLIAVPVPVPVPDGANAYLAYDTCIFVGRIRRGSAAIRQTLHQYINVMRCALA